MSMLQLANHPLLSTRNLLKVIGEFEPDPADYMLAQEMPIVPVEQHKIAYDVRIGAGGMTLAASDGAESPTVSFGGVAQTEFEPPEFREKVILTAKEITSIRKLGTENEVETAQAIIARKANDLRTRLETRMEWMRWQAFFGSLDVVQSDVELHIDYKIPADMTPTLTGSDIWSNSASDPMENLLEWMEIFRDLPAKPSMLLFNSLTNRILMQNTKIRTIRDAMFTGQPNRGMLTTQNLQDIVNAYAGLPYKVYDGGFREVTEITSAVSASGTSLVLREVGTLSAGDTVNLVHRDGEVSGRVRLTVDTVTASTKTITVDAPGADIAYPAGSRLYVKKFFIPDNKFIIKGTLPSSIEGGSQYGAIIATLHPYGPGGMMDMSTGPFIKTLPKDDDPPSLSIICGVKGAPVLYHRDVNLIATVG